MKTWLYSMQTYKNNKWECPKGLSWVQLSFIITSHSLFVRRYLHKKPDEGDLFSSAAADNDDAMPAMEDEDSDSVTLRRRRLAAAAERRMQRQEPSPF